MGIGFTVLYSLLLRAGYILHQWTTNEGMGNFARSPHGGSHRARTDVRQTTPCHGTDGSAVIGKALRRGLRARWR
jgi:hypothetical protein